MKQFMGIKGHYGTIYGNLLTNLWELREIKGNYGTFYGMYVKIKGFYLCFPLF